MATDPSARVRVLKLLDLGRETHYRNGRVDKHPGLMTRVVKSLHETVRQHGHAYDCWVEQEAFLGATGRGAGALRDREEPSGTTIRVPI